MQERGSAARISPLVPSFQRVVRWPTPTCVRKQLHPCGAAVATPTTPAGAAATTMLPEYKTQTIRIRSRGPLLRGCASLRDFRLGIYTPLDVIDDCFERHPGLSCFFACNLGPRELHQVSLLEQARKVHFHAVGWLHHAHKLGGSVGASDPRDSRHQVFARDVHHRGEVLLGLTILEQSTRRNPREFLLRSNIRIDRRLGAVSVSPPRPPEKNRRDRRSEQPEPQQPVDDRQHDEGTRRFRNSQRGVGGEHGFDEDRSVRQGQATFLALERDPHIWKSERLSADIPRYDMIK